MSLAVSDTYFQCFGNHYPKKILTNDLVYRIVKALPFIYQPDRVVRKANYVSAADWRYQTREKIRYFFTCVVTAFRRARNPFYNTVVYMIISIYAAMTKFLNFPSSLR